MATSLRDEEGVRTAYAAHGGELFAHALRRLGDAELAEEAVQDVFVRAWQAADRFDADRGSLRTWLFAIARNVETDLALTRLSEPHRSVIVETVLRDRPYSEWPWRPGYRRAR